MIYPVLIYFFEIKLRTIYSFISFCICILILFLYFETLFLMHVLPLLSITHNKFISIDVTELFTTILFLVLYIVFLILFNLIKNQIC